MSRIITSRTFVAVGAIALITVAMIWKVAFLPTLASQASISTPFDAPFHLVDQSGNSFSNASFKSEPRVLFFGYTSCPDVCPMTLASLSRWIDKVKPQHTRFAFVTVDPERDTPQVLKEYLTAFAPGIIGLTGRPPAVSKMLDAYRIYRQRVAGRDGFYTINHTATLFLVDGHGNLQNTIAHDENDNSAIAKLKRLDASASDAALSARASRD